MRKLNQIRVVKKDFSFLFFVFWKILCLEEQKGTIEYDKEGERITVNFDQKLQVK